MFGIKELLMSVDGRLSAVKDAKKVFYDKVTTQSSRHTSRSEMRELFDIARPNEDSVFKKWRESNRRHITVSPILSFKRMLVRVLQQSISIDENIYPNINRFIYDNILYRSLYDPNALIVEFPFNPVNPDLPLTLPPEVSGLFQNQSLETKTLVIASSSILLYRDDMLIFKFGTYTLDDKEEPMYISLDNNDYGLLVPYYLESKRNNTKEIKYKYEPWYHHGLGYLPIADLPGEIMPINEKGNETYKESFCFGAYEYLDEAVIALSSDQVSRIRHSSPKLVMDADIDCPDCNGTRAVEVQGKTKPCKSCNGTGSVAYLGDFSTIKINRKVNQSNSASIYYLDTPGNIEYTKQVWEDFVAKAERQLCTDLLEGIGNESGLAKEYRLEPKQDLLRDFGEQFCNTVEKFINNRIALRGDNIEPVNIVAPLHYSTKSSEVLLLSLANSMPGDRYNRYMDYISTKYRDDSDALVVHKLSVIYAPLLLYADGEITNALNSGAYSDQDIIRRDYAIFVLTKILAEMNYTYNSVKDVMDKADVYLRKNGILPEEIQTIIPDVIDI